MIITIAPDKARYEAREHNRWSCPIAVAIANKLPKGSSACVTETHIRLLIKGGPNGRMDYTMTTSDEMFGWIRKYDMGLIVPTDVTFDIHIPDEFMA